MSKILAAITGVHGYVPETVLTNAMLEEMVETTDDWITTRTGIKERRILKEEGAATSDMATRAVMSLLKKTSTSANDIDLVICATVTADHIFPDTANIIRDKVGITEGYGYDVNAACSGFLFALSAGAQAIESGRHKKVIVIGADMMSTIVDYSDRTTCVIFGDGAAAVLLEPDNSGPGIQDFILRGDGSGREFLNMKAGGSKHPPTEETVKNKEHFVFQDGRPVFKAAVKGMSGTVEKLMERNSMSKDDLSWLVPHQANKRIIDSVSNAMDFPKERVMVNIQKYGNTTAATIPLCLWEYESQLRKGDNIILTAFGGGFTWGALYLKWAYNGSHA